MNFSSILDISSFFIGMIINLVLVSLMCYYFKRKYEVLESAQTEQAKILYELLRRDSNKRTELFVETLPEVCPVKVEKVDYTQDPLLKKHVMDSDLDSDSESDSDSDSDLEFEVTLPPNPPVSPKLSRPASPASPESEPPPMVEWSSIEIQVETQESQEPKDDKSESKQNEIKEIVIELDTETNYSKMSIKQLKDVLTSKGVKHKHNMKKDELVDLLKDAEGEVTI